MILDGLLLFSSGTTYGTGTLAIADSITTVGTPANSTNVIDLGPGPTNTALPPSFAFNTPVGQPAQPFRDIGIGDDPAMKILVQCLNSFVGGTSLQVGLQGAPDSGTGTPGTFNTWWSSPAYVPAQLTAGSRLMDMDMPRPPAGFPEPRFLRLLYTIAGTFSPVGLLLATIVLDRHDQVYNTQTVNNVLGGYPAGVVVVN